MFSTGYGPSIIQGVVAVVALIGVTIAAILGNITGEALIAIYTAVIGFSFGAGTTLATANGVVATAKDTTERSHSLVEEMKRKLDEETKK